MNFPSPVFDDGVACYLDVSTCHITKKDDELLQKHSVRGSHDAGTSALAVYWHDWGYWLYAHDDVGVYEMALEQGFSQALIDLMKYANERRCTWIKLDCDGWEHPGSLKVFEW